MFSLDGKWQGGPHRTIEIGVNNDGSGFGVFPTPGGQKGGMKGLMMDGCRRFKGYWWDPEQGHSDAENDIRLFDMKLDTGGKSWSATWTSEAGSGSWTGRKAQWRPGSAKAGWYKNKESWDRLTAVKNKVQWAERARGALLEDEAKLKRTDLNGMLAETMPLCIGEAYDDKKKRTGRDGGLNMTSAAAKKGYFGPGVYFSTPAPLAKGDSYEDAITRARRRRAEEIAAKKKMGDRPDFKPTGPQQAESHLKIGYLGKVSKETSKSEVEALWKAERAKKAAIRRDVTLGPRNILTNPIRKGTYGYTGTLLGHKTDDGRDLLHYEYEGFGQAEQIRRAEAKKQIEDRGDRPAFAPRAHAKNDGLFDRNADIYKGGGLGPGGGAILTFRNTSARRPKSAPAGRKGGDDDEEPPPFVPPRGPQTGKVGTFSTFPVHIPDPAPAPVYHARGEDDRHWKPSRSGHPPRPVSSVLFSKKNVARGMRKLSRGATANDVARALMTVKRPGRLAPATR